MTDIDIQVNDALENLGVTKFTLSSDSGLFTIHFVNGDDTLRFGLENTRLKTLENFTGNAQVFKLNGQNLDPDTIGKFKQIFMTEEYEQFFTPPEKKSKQRKSEVQEFNAFKYGTGIPLAEQIKLNGKHVFLQIIDGKPAIKPFLDLSKDQNMMIYPTGKTPINDFEYDSKEEIQQIIEIAKTKTIDELYKWSKSIWQKFVVVTPEQLTLLTLDSIFTFFHDRFTTTHYTMLVARVGSGKGAALIVLTYLGYRVILGSSISGASLLDLFGTLEPAQVVIAEDELNFVKDDSEKRRLYTGGYDIWGLSTRTLDGSTSNRKMRWFPGFGYKIFGAENSLDANGLGGLSDRTFVMNLLKGKPELYVKNLRKIRLSAKYQAALSEINRFRKIMLVHRLLHAHDLFEEVATNIDGRALELTGPTIELFYALSKDKTLLKNEILPALSFFLQEKGDLSKDSLDNIIYSAIEELGGDKQYHLEDNDKVFIVPHKEIYEKVRILSDGTEIKTDVFTSPIIDEEVSAKTILKHCRDKLHAKKTSSGRGNEKKRALSFNKQTIASLKASYETITKIELLEDKDDNVGTQGRKTTSQGYKEDNSTSSEDSNGPETVYESQEFKQDNVNLTTSEGVESSQYPKNTSPITPTDQIIVPSSPNITQNSSTNSISVLSSPTTKQQDVKQVLGSCVAFDFEWSDTGDNTIDAASFVWEDGTSEVKFRERDFGGSEPKFLNYIMDRIFSREWSIGWHTQSNTESIGGKALPDLRVLFDRCKKHRIECIVKLGYRGVPYIARTGYKHIDLYNVYTKPMIKEGIFHKAYRTNKLEVVAPAVLGYGKHNNYNGGQFKTLPIEEQEKYSLQDSQLVMDLAKYKNFEALDAMLAIADITELDFEYVCKTEISTWWAAIFDKLVKRGQCPSIKKHQFSGTYKGAEVLPPKKGFYQNIVVADAKSLYPGVGINCNISFDTINCECCKDNPDAKVSKIIPSEFSKDCKYINPDNDWICRLHTGAFPSMLKIFREQRFKEMKAGNEAKAYVLKILINGGYGVFGSEHYDYYDPRVAELVTAAGRHMLSKMQHIANYEYGFEIVYGDTRLHLSEQHIRATTKRVSRKVQAGI